MVFVCVDFGSGVCVGRYAGMSLSMNLLCGFMSTPDGPALSVVMFP